MTDQNKSNEPNESGIISDSLPANEEIVRESKSSSDSRKIISDLGAGNNSPAQNKRKNSSSPLSLFSTTLVFGICILSLVALIGTYIKTKNKFSSQKETVSTEVPTNLKGSVLELRSIECGWELSPELESLSPPSVIVPVLTIKETTGNDGYLQVTFKDKEGNIQGDPNTYQFMSKSGSFANQNGKMLKVKSTSGLNNMLNFSSYKLADTKNSIGPWSATIMESGENGEWTTLAAFEIPGIQLSPTNQ
ncbi:MAG: hypothetical protein VX646_06710 [Verrucomicrobiota bacterium]|nr:hypothetical protein [Verrucomicrobiota bacterium]